MISGRTEALEAQANDDEVSQVIHAKRSTITARDQTVVSAPIRERFGLGPSTRLEWIVDGDGAIRVVPVDLDPIRAFRGSGAGGGTTRLLKELQLDRRKEDGAERVAQLLQAARSGESRCLVCFMSRMEVLDRVLKDEGERHARLADAQLQSLPITWVPCSDALLEQAAAIKACPPLSLAAAWIAAAAQREGAVLVHKDPEFRALDQVPQEWLG